MLHPVKLAASQARETTADARPGAAAQSYSTWLSGAALLMIVYWVGAELYLIDPSKADLAVWQGILISAGSLTIGWLVYDLLCKSPLGKHDGAFDVGGLAGREIEGQGPAMFVAQGMDLGVASALCAADGLSRGPPFPPPAQRCALTWVVSMETCSGVPAKLSVKAANRYCQCPFCDQRL